MEGYGLVKKKVHGVGAEMISSVKYDEVFGGKLHSNIPFSAAITVAVFGQDYWEYEDLASNLQKSKDQVVQQ
jgi:hypothetical protein